MYIQDSEKAKSWVQNHSHQVIAQMDDTEIEGFFAFLKYLSNIVDRRQPNLTDASSTKLSSPITKEELAKWFEELCEQVVQAGEPDTFVKEYKTSEVAKFMGVTVATVNNWIKEDRVRGVIKENKYAHARIPETAIYVTQSNEPVIIKEIAERYYIKNDTKEK
jgi:hypothetical protein